ncbi:SDR family oxidoreductase [Hoyosella subflava]|uniref:Putative short chain dehydrogenase n=1 Tax=Hoyosella subflava (strain DSM 45089 / JCM 17490 / NBRC 109087 / DQS3-9A1) TaxID=443218 RepID=F6EHK7_HOYSD|nr:SDR family oxidoreductase [Hoyosella subflava]AEF42371.1 Putative short chain dehydrogenase [Hoyosella subflava DQS3-9A1]
MKTVENKKVLITGAAMGMGKLYAQLAAKENASAIVLWDINEVALKQTTDELRANGATVHPYVVDVSSQEAIEEAAAQVRDEVGDIEVLFNNAGVVRGNAYFWETDSTRDTAFTMKINALAPMIITREFLPGMVAAEGECRVINVASAAGLTANPRMASYCGSKWAAVGWSDSVRLELEQAGHRHVKVTTVCPYYISTGMFDGAKAAPLLPILEPEAVVTEVWKQMKKGAPFVILPKTVLLSEAFKGILPTSIRDFVAGRVLGVYKTMEHFTGRDPQKV